MAAVVASVAALLWLHRVHRRASTSENPSQDNSTNPKRHFFRSSQFDDSQILAQLASLEHQVRLDEHGDWPEISDKGICVVSLAEKLQKILQPSGNDSSHFLPLNQAFEIFSKNIPSGLVEAKTQVLDGLRECAESYLSREARPAPSWATNVEVSSNHAQPSKIVETVFVTSKTVRNRHYLLGNLLAKGSAGLVYAAKILDDFSKKKILQDKNAEKISQNDDETFNYVLKRVYPTQKDSAMNEYRISTRLNSSKKSESETYCLTYTEQIVEGDDVWLVMPRVFASEKWGVDLREYLSKGFFQSDEGRGEISRDIVLQLLKAASHVAGAGVCVRDVKPDNVLMVRKKNLDEKSRKKISYEIRLTDFGLAIDLNDLRTIDDFPKNNQDVKTQLVQYWYDVCKLVPRPKWKARRPPERAVQKPSDRIPISSFDVYMFGIIIVCVALGVDVPHIDDARIFKSFSSKIDVDEKNFPKDYLKSWNLEDLMRERSESFIRNFRETFQDEKFARVLFKRTKEMVSKSPETRPKPEAVLEELTRLLEEESKV